MKAHSLFARGEVLFLPLCVCALAAAGCTTQVELPMPNGAYVAEPQAKKTAPAPETAAVPVREKPQEQEVILFELNPQEPAEDPVLPPVPEKKPAAKTAAKPAVKSAEKPAAKPAGQEILYKVKKGDTLGAIAGKHKMSATALAGYNGIQVNKVLQIGETICIPVSAGSENAKSAKTAVKEDPKPAVKEEAKPAVKDAKDAKNAKDTAKTKGTAETAVSGGAVYIVKPGDTLGGIAWRHSVKVSQIAELNKIDPKAMLPAGKKLILPKEAKLREAKTETKKQTASKSEAKPAAAASKPAAKSEVKPSAAKTSAEKIVKPAEKTAEKPASAPGRETSADDIINAIGSGNESASAPVKQPEAPAAAPEVKKPETPAASSSLSLPPPQENSFDDLSVISVPLQNDATLEEAARIYDRSYQAVKSLNPGISETQKLKAGTQIKIPIY